jgi:ubiquinone/menaquinone biosynthesis C-methylase UbiE
MDTSNQNRQRSAAFYGDAFAKAQTQPAAAGKHVDLLTGLLQTMLVRPDFGLLDVGCGDGKIARLVKHLYPQSRVVGIDISDAALEKARACPEAVEYLHSNEFSMPFADGTFDYATCRMSIHHYPDVSRHLAEMRRVLKPQGQYLILDCLPPDDDAREVINTVFLCAERQGHGDGHVQFYTAKDYDRLLGAAGFESTAIQT